MSKNTTGVVSAPVMCAQTWQGTHYLTAEDTMIEDTNLPWCDDCLNDGWFECLCCQTPTPQDDQSDIVGFCWNCDKDEHECDPWVARTCEDCGKVLGYENESADSAYLCSCRDDETDDEE